MPIGSIVGGLIGQQGALQGGQAAAQAGQDAYKASQDQKHYIETIQSPFYNTGVGAENKLSRLYGLGSLVDRNGGKETDATNAPADQQAEFNAFRASPGYQFRLDQGLKAVGNSGSAKGMTLSGAQAKALNDYAGGSASQEWGNYLSGLTGLASGGQGSANAIVSGTNDIMKPGIAEGFQGSVDRASSYSNAANALASGIGNAFKSASSLAPYALAAL